MYREIDRREWNLQRVTGESVDYLIGVKIYLAFYELRSTERRNKVKLTASKS